MHEKRLRVKGSLGLTAIFRSFIVNPAGEVVQTAELLKKNDFFCESTKGMWKVVFEVNKEIKVNYKLWEGNLKSLDPLSEE